MKTYFISLLIAGLFLISFNNPDNLKNDSIEALPYQINIEKGINNVRSVLLSTVGSQLEYIPLETNPDCLLRNASNAFVSDSFIYVSDGSKLLLFGRNGKFLRQIGSSGRGPGEYSRISDYIIDKDNREIFVLSNSVVLVYDFNGQFKKDFKLDFPCMQFILKDRNSIVFHPFNMAQPTSGPVYSLYITDKKGVVQSKIINTLKRVNGGMAVPISPLYIYDGTMHFMEFGIDTLYNFKNLVKIPYAIFHYGKMKIDPDPTIDELPNHLKGKIWLNSVRENAQFIFIRVIQNTLSNSFTCCIFDKSSSEFTVLKEHGFINDIDGGMIFWPKKILNGNTLIDYADASDIIKYMNNKSSANVNLKDRKKAEQFSNVVKQLTETSNPVLIMLKQ